MRCMTHAYHGATIARDLGTVDATTRDLADAT